MEQILFRINNTLFSYVLYNERGVYTKAIAFTGKTESLKIIPHYPFLKIIITYLFILSKLIILFIY